MSVRKNDKSWAQILKDAAESDPNAPMRGWWDDALEAERLAELKRERDLTTASLAAAFEARERELANPGTRIWHLLFDPIVRMFSN